MRATMDKMDKKDKDWDNWDRGARTWGLALLMGLLVAATGWASEKNNQGGNGSEIPTPFSTMNQYVELADGEPYVLVGTVQVRQNYRAFFFVDLEQHPWLANSRRRVRPYYPLKGSVSFWKSYDGKRVKIPLVARGMVTSSRGGTGEYEIELSYENAGGGEEPLPIEMCFRETGACY